MAITLGTFTKLDDGVFTGTLKTLNVTAALTIVPVDKMSDNAPDLPGLCRPAPRGRRRLEPGREVERRDLPEPQDRRARIRAELGPLPPGQARTPRRRRRHPHRPVGAARPLTSNDAPPRVTAAGLPSRLLSTIATATTRSPSLGAAVRHVRFSGM